MKKVFTVLLVIAAIAMGYLFYDSLATPENFKKEQAKRELLIQQRLKQIVEAESAFENVYGKFATAEELVAFLESGKLYYINAKGDYTDEMREQGISERDAARKGLIMRDTVWMPAKDSLLKNGMTAQDFIKVPGFPASNVEIQVSTIDQKVGNDNVKVPVFMASVPMTVYLGDLDKTILEQKIKAAKELYDGKGYPGLAIGSLEEVKNTGNWE